MRSILNGSNNRTPCIYSRIAYPNSDLWGGRYRQSTRRGFAGPIVAERVHSGAGSTQFIEDIMEGKDKIGHHWPTGQYIRCKLLILLWRRGGDSNPRYRFKPVRRFSKPLLSTTQPPLRGGASFISMPCGHCHYTIFHSAAFGWLRLEWGD